ncbi:hypothetical protein WMF20_18140 [Sorangium sp. So ce834]|uniref:hypothetical protein n=1 Tax=Sorangium sp. So ce834 TaxID=3133321 RepID=UPI003F61908C
MSFFLAAGCSDSCIAGVLTATPGKVYAGLERSQRDYPAIFVENSAQKPEWRAPLGGWS